MKITGRGLFVAGGVLLLLSQGDRLKANLQEGSEVSNLSQQASQQARQNQVRAGNLERIANTESQLAEGRYNAGCIMLRSSTTNQPIRFTDTTLAHADNPDPENLQLLDSGTLVCNALGETGVVEVNGYIADIKRLNAEALQRFKNGGL